VAVWAPMQQCGGCLVDEEEERVLRRCGGWGVAGQGTDWKANTLNVAFLFPSIVFVIFFALNLLIWGQKSSGAVPFGGSSELK
jgi:hypothetical protein